jgi:hypothetical protein
MAAVHPGTSTRFLRPLALTLALTLASIATMTLVSALSTSGDVKVSDRPYVRHDGGSDATIASCSSDATTPTAGGDGGGNRQQNEPAVAINPQQTQVIVGGANDNCAVPTIGDGWLGLYVSRDSGATWVNSLVPGYPTDTSTEGQASPSFGRATAGSDPIIDWDNENRLFYGGVFFNRTATNPSGVVVPGRGDMTVSTFVYDPATPLGINYVRTVVVGQGTPSIFGAGRFNDKPSLRVDDWEGSPHEGNVYVSWTLFPGVAGNDQIVFARSTDHGASFSHPVKISKRIAVAQSSDIAVGPDGTVYVFWRQFNVFVPGIDDAIVFVKSTDGGETFSDPAVARSIIPNDRLDRYLNGSLAGDCGDGAFECVSHFVFHRADSGPQAIVDAGGNVYVTWEQLVPAADNGDTYHPDGQSRAVVSKSTNAGGTWSAPVPIDPQATGHQWWPNLEFDRSTGTIVAVYYDSREDPSYSVNRPPGNTAAALSVCGGAATCNVLNTFIAASADGVAWTSIKVTTVGHQPEYEMYGDRQIPFHGDYLWIDANGGTAFGVWTDNRDVVPGVDIRETVDDGFDVLQCRPTAGSPDLCPNAGGLNQNIYGARVILP